MQAAVEDHCMRLMQQRWVQNLAEVVENDAVLWERGDQAADPCRPEAQGQQTRDLQIPSPAVVGERA